MESEERGMWDTNAQTTTSARTQVAAAAATEDRIDGWPVAA
jgi:hypothetical protein